MEEKINVVSMN